MVVVFVALAAGIIVGRYLPLPPGLWVTAGLAALALAAATLRRSHLHALTVAAVAATVFFGGAFSAVLAYHRLDAGHEGAGAEGRRCH